VKSAAAFFVAPVGYLFLFALWRTLWPSGLLVLSIPALAIFLVAEYLVVRVGWDRALWPFSRLPAGFWASVASAVVRGLALCLPAVVMLSMMRSLSWTAVFVPFIYEAELSLFASRAVLFGFWAVALLVPFGVFLWLKRFRAVLSLYVPLAIVFVGFLSIYNAFDRIAHADADLDPLVEVVSPRGKLMRLADAGSAPIARDIYVEGDLVFASFGTTVSPATSFVKRMLGGERSRRTPAVVRYDMGRGWTDVVYGGTVKYMFSRPSDEHLYFAFWSEFPQAFRLRKRGSMTAEPVTPLVFELTERWDNDLPLLSIMDLYVDRARRNLYFSSDELPACFRVDLDRGEITGEVNLLKLGFAPWGAGVRRLHVDPDERYMYLVTYASPASVVKVSLDGFVIAGQRASARAGGMYGFYHDAAFDWERGVGYGFPFDGEVIEVFRLSDLMTLYAVETNLSPMRFQVRGARVLDDGRVVMVTYFGEIFLFDPDGRRLHLLCSRTGGRADDLEIGGGYVYLNNYAGIVRLPLDELLARAE